MRSTFMRKNRVSAPPNGSGATDEQSELALLAEFMRHDSVTALAGAIAERRSAREGSSRRRGPRLEAR
jgi:hypothetical protein